MKDSFRLLLAASAGLLLASILPAYAAPPPPVGAEIDPSLLSLVSLGVSVGAVNVYRRIKGKKN